MRKFAVLMGVVFAMTLSFASPSFANGPHWCDKHPNAPICTTTTTAPQTTTTTTVPQTTTTTAPATTSTTQPASTTTTKMTTTTVCTGPPNCMPFTGGGTHSAEATLFGLGSLGSGALLLAFGRRRRTA